MINFKKLFAEMNDVQIADFFFSQREDMERHEWREAMQALTQKCWDDGFNEAQDNIAIELEAERQDGYDEGYDAGYNEATDLYCNGDD